MSWASEVAADSPLAWYRMDDALASTTIADSSGNSRNASYPTLVRRQIEGLQGDGNPAANFNGQNGVATAYAAWMDNATFSVEAIVRVSLNSLMSIVDRDQSGGRVFQFRINGGNLEFVKTAGTVVTVTSALAIPLFAGHPRHCVATYDGANIKLYVDGVQVASGAATGSLAGGSPLLIGASYAGTSGTANQQLTGALDEIALYGSALSAARVAAHFAAMTKLQMTGASAPFSKASVPPAHGTSGFVYRGRNTKTLDLGAV